MKHHSLVHRRVIVMCVLSSNTTGTHIILRHSVTEHIVMSGVVYLFINFSVFSVGHTLLAKYRCNSFIVDLRHKFTVRNMNEIPVFIKSSELSNIT